MGRRLDDLKRFYSLLNDLEIRLGGAKTLADCTGRGLWPDRGVYFFREAGEQRRDTGNGFRVVRVGTHALKAGSRAKLWTRLSQHKGIAGSGGGNHRGSIFRLIVGTALIARDRFACPSWGVGNTATRAVKDSEFALECEVSRHIGRMPFLYLKIEDDAGPNSIRGLVERNTIALLSNFNRAPLDRPSPSWLGNYCDRERVRRSGLWNSNHIDEHYDPAYLDVLDRLISSLEMRPC